MDRREVKDLMLVKRMIQRNSSYNTDIKIEKGVDSDHWKSLDSIQATMVKQ